ncbi:MAG: ABC transporter ATP-binding protein [Chloroflexi bacterium]|jgi:ATP-binding cassette subfamily B protein|nr:MAG: ABC transporter [Chloroflexi bacterium OLB13]MBC6956941.1 ABC transporter ATP-binding protein [Chloroflexota bacterium]MBV6437942.1 putative multidrug export ATP-binding/permease protein [Anaerolineae bacterium]MCC6566720.1 ABC transporter ATP-binding protein [Chloroflexota bacterium]MCO6442877.1 ABC transporter ATP-binding protein [Anaerolineae bacterium]
MQAVQPMERGRGRARRKSGPNTLGRAIRYLGKQRRTAIIAYGALIVATLAQLAVPLLTQNMIDTVTQGAVARTVFNIENPVTRGLATLAVQQGLGTTPERLEAFNLNAESWLIGAAAIILMFTIVRAGFSFTSAYMAEVTSQGLAFDFRNEIFAKLQRLSFSYYDRNQTGQLMIRATDDVEKVRLFIAQGLVLAVQALLLLSATLIILLLTNWRLTLVVIPILPFALVLFMIFGAVAQPLFAEVQKRLSRLNTILQENLAGIRVVKAFVRESHEQGHFDGAADSVFAQALKVTRTFAFLFPVVFLMAQLGQALILYFGSGQIIDGSLTLGEYQQFSLYLLYVFFPIGQLGFIISLMAQATASSNRVFEILDAKSDVSNKPDAVDLPAVSGQVEFRNVTFRYFGSSAPVLDGVSFTAQPGQTIALLGATGSGKSTIINLIPRFYDASEGAVLIDGHDVRDVTLDSLRSQIGIVLQETNLFGGTIRDNIAFGRPDAPLEDVIEAAKAAAAHDFITGFAQGYDTPVGERGSSLSGGQKQRIAIARALLLNPRLLILDDSTSAVDLQTEAHIQRALDNLMRGRTSFVIAQRITTVLNADQIIVLDKGKIAAIGTHADLLENSAIYAEIYNSQLIGDAVAER